MSTFQLPSAGNQVPRIGKKEKNIGGFINFALIREGSESVHGTKIDTGLRLDFDDPGQKALYDLLQTPEGIEKFRSKVIITCHANKPATEKGMFIL